MARRSFWVTHCCGVATFVSPIWATLHAEGTVVCNAIILVTFVGYIVVQAVLTYGLHKSSHMRQTLNGIGELVAGRRRRLIREKLIESMTASSGPSFFLSSIIGEPSVVRPSVVRRLVVRWTEFLCSNAVLQIGEALF